jgi:formate hydrogenlyase subunit 3/multisubunit Na+/H+ antiporter MnhD subunit
MPALISAGIFPFHMIVERIYPRARLHSKAVPAGAM